MLLPGYRSTECIPVVPGGVCVAAEITSAWAGALNLSLLKVKKCNQTAKKELFMHILLFLIETANFYLHIVFCGIFHSKTAALWSNLINSNGSFIHFDTLDSQVPEIRPTWEIVGIKVINEDEYEWIPIFFSPVFAQKIAHSHSIKSMTNEDGKNDNTVPYITFILFH